MHSYSGSLETAQSLLKRNTWFSFSTSVQRIEKQTEVLRQLPLERIFLETDFTDCTQEQHRQALEELYAFVADLRGISTEELKKVLQNNLKTLFSP